MGKKKIKREEDAPLTLSHIQNYVRPKFGEVPFSQRCKKIEDKFARYNREDYFPELLDVIKSKNNYKTYLDTVVNEDPDFAPSYFSVYRKYLDNKIQFLDSKEVLCSRIANLLGIPTVYNQFVMNKETGKREMVSVDFLQDGDTFYSLRDLGVRWKNLPKEPILLSKIMPKIRAILQTQICPFMKERKYEIDYLEQEFIKDYVLKYLILNDKNYTPDDKGLIKNKKQKTIRVSPSFDYSSCLNTTLQSRSNKDIRNMVVNDALNYINDRYPNLLHEFYQRLCDGYSGEKVRNITNQVFKNEDLSSSPTLDEKGNPYTNQDENPLRTKIFKNLYDFSDELSLFYSHKFQQISEDRKKHNNINLPPNY